MAGANRSKLVRVTVRNIGCIGNDGVEIELDNVVCLVGKNNAGKSTILRAYELAKGSAQFSESKDRCVHAAAEHPCEVQLEVHIPEGIGNVDAKWKTPKDGLLIVRSRWQWAAPNFDRVRTTWIRRLAQTVKGIGRRMEKRVGLIPCLAPGYQDRFALVR